MCEERKRINRHNKSRRTSDEDVRAQKRMRKSRKKADRNHEKQILREQYRYYQ